MGKRRRWDRQWNVVGFRGESLEILKIVDVEGKREEAENINKTSKPPIFKKADGFGLWFWYEIAILSSLNISFDGPKDSKVSGKNGHLWPENGWLMERCEATGGKAKMPLVDRQVGQVGWCLFVIRGSSGKAGIHES